MNPSKLRHRIKIYRRPDPEEDVDEVGQPLDEPIHHVDVWASIEPLRGRILESARQFHSEVTTELTIRYREDITDTMLATYKGITFEFLYILHKDYAEKTLQIYTKENKDGQTR